MGREPDLPGQTVVVIGGSSGIGLETARRARAEGADVILVGRNPERLHACVRAGASVSFVLPFSHEDAKAFWIDQVLPGVAAGTRSLLIARLSNRIIGTVQLDLATPPNQPHRAEVRKLLVHPDVRRRGIAKALMIAVDQVARTARRTLLTLDTVTGGPAERLYQSLGYFSLGSIPRYALNFDSRVLESTTVMYKDLTTSEQGKVHSFSLTE